MAKHTYRLLEQGAASGYPAFETLEPGAEFEHDFATETFSAPDVERAVIAAGWVERVDTDKEAKGGKKVNG